MQGRSSRRDRRWLGSAREVVWLEWAVAGTAAVCTTMGRHPAAAAAGRQQRQHQQGLLLTCDSAADAQHHEQRGAVAKVKLKPAGVGRVWGGRKAAAQLCAPTTAAS
jgi:hypothetical protein